MGHLQGLKEYLHEVYNHSVFDQMLTSQQLWEMHLHGQRIVQARVVQNETYDLVVEIEGQGKEELPKLQVKYLYPADSAAAIGKQLKIEKTVQGLGLEPIYAPAQRYIVKNKTLFSPHARASGGLLYPAGRGTHQRPGCRVQPVRHDDPRQRRTADRHYAAQRV
jgi:hypothetical protein